MSEDIRIVTWQRDRYRQALEALLEWLEEHGEADPDFPHMKHATAIREALGEP